mgnify:FL=1|jgi:hypothetical protein|tara:strand:- start:155 stop:718 length:564 start_codon:yes stop_codon:yes gene_type:complete
MNKEINLIKELEEYSKKTEEFNLIVSKGSIELSPYKEPNWFPFLWIFLSLCLPIFTLFLNWIIEIKLITSILWIGSIIYGYYKISKGNRIVLIDKNERLIKWTNNSSFFKNLIKDSEVKFNKITSVKVEEKIESSDYKTQKSIIYHSVNIETNSGKKTISMFNDNLIAKKLALLIKILIEDNTNHNN